MSLLKRMRASFARLIDTTYVNVTFRMDRQVAYELLPIIKRMAPGTHDAWALINAVKVFFLDQRPIIAVHKGEETRAYIEGPQYACGSVTFPLGAQVFVDRAGWVNLNPVEAHDLHLRIGKAIDEAILRWLGEEGQLMLASPGRKERDRQIDDPVALRQMAAAASPALPNEEPANV